ncbi:MAG: hypothetical protein Q9208_004015 [Pyrenodesmia sp. 3 TL-2023]
MGWLWASKATPDPPKPLSLGEEIPTDSTPAIRDIDSTANPAPAQNADHDAELQALLSSLDSKPKPSVASARPQELPITPDDTTLTPSSHYPTEMSCRSAFDSAFYCQSLGGQFNNVYRYGTFRDCREQWSQFWFCVKTNKGFLGDEERESRIRNHYKLREMKYRVGASSEDVWQPRTKKLETAFAEDLEAAEAAEVAEATERTESERIS